MSEKYPICGAVPDEILEAMKNIRRGPKNSKKLAELDAQASAAVDRGEVANEREAAKKFLPQYGNEGVTPDHRNNRIKDIAKRIENYRRNKAE